MSKLVQFKKDVRTINNEREKTKNMGLSNAKDKFDYLGLQELFSNPKKYKFD